MAAPPLTPSWRCVGAASSVVTHSHLSSPRSNRAAAAAPAPSDAAAGAPRRHAGVGAPASQGRQRGQPAVTARAMARWSEGQLRFPFCNSGGAAPCYTSPLTWQAPPPTATAPSPHAPAPAPRFPLPPIFPCCLAHLAAMSPAVSACVIIPTTKLCPGLLRWRGKPLPACRRMPCVRGGGNGWGIWLV